MMSSHWYFIAIWVGSKRVLAKIEALLRNYLWSGARKTTRAWVSWDNCMISKKVRGLSLISLEDAMKTFMNKRIIQALLCSKLNLQIILRYRITLLHPSYHGPWGPSSLWVFSPNFSTKCGSKVWHHITQSWKVMASMVAYLPLSIANDILQLNLWWRTKYQGLYFGISMSRACTLYTERLRYFMIFGTPGHMTSWIERLPTLNFP